MAIKFPSFKVFSNTDAKSRVFLLFFILLSIGIAVFFTIRYFNANKATGTTHVAAAPSGLQSVPGGQISPEYYRVLMQANAQSAQQAKITGSSAVPTLVNIPSQSSGFLPASGQPAQSCTVLCPTEDAVNVENDINDLVKAGKLLPKDAAALLALAKNNSPVDEYALALNKLVKEGKLTPEQARKLLEQYKKQYQNALLKESAVPMDALIKTGQLPLAVANQLLTLQKNNVTPAEYARELNRLVADNKITPQAASQLLNQYTQQQAREATKQGLFRLQQLAKAGAITPEVANQLMQMQAKNVPLDQYAAELQRLVAAGKITPAVAEKLLAEYRARRMNTGGAADILADLIQQQTVLCQKSLEQQKKSGNSNPQTMTPECQKLAQLKEQAQRLMNLQANNAAPSMYAEELKRAVKANLLTPEIASSLMQYYQATAASFIPSTAQGASTETTLPTTADFASLQQAVQASQQSTAASTPADQQASAEFKAAAAQAAQQLERDRAEKIQQLQVAMSAQAQTLIAAWQPPKMAHQAGVASSSKGEGSLFSGLGKKATVGGGVSGATALTERPLIKAGTILFGVLDTAVDSDYPDTPVMVTVVQGPFKGAKLLGKLSLAQGKDRVSLSFNLMDKDEWNKTKTVSAFAIDPDTARTVMASNVDHHYLMRYGSLFASSFLTGYANGVLNAGNSTTGIFGTSTTHPQLSFGNNVAVALGQVGTAFTGAVQQNINTPNTVKVNSGVGLGILFMSDVT